MPEQLVIGFNPMSAANKVAYSGRQIRSRLLWLVVSVVICVWLWVWQRRSMSPAGTAAMFGLALVYSLIWLLIAFVNWRRAKSALKAIAPGVAVVVDRRGLWLQGVGVAWSQLSQIAIRPGRFRGSPVLMVRLSDGSTTRIPLANLNAMPGTIDSAIRSYSGGNWWIDTSKLGN